MPPLSSFLNAQDRWGRGHDRASTAGSMSSVRGRNRRSVRCPEQLVDCRQRLEEGKDPGQVAEKPGLPAVMPKQIPFSDAAFQLDLEVK